MNNNLNTPNQAPDFKKMGKGMLAVAWLFLMGIMFLIFKGYEIKTSSANNTKSFTANGAVELHIPISRDNSYEVYGKINGSSVLFLVDTGATSIAIPERVAIDAGLKKGMAITTETAGGHTTAYLTTIDKLYIGDNIFLTNVRATINPRLPGSMALLGMGALRQLHFQQQDRTLILIQRKN